MRVVRGVTGLAARGRLLPGGRHRAPIATPVVVPIPSVRVKVVRVIGICACTTAPTIAATPTATAAPTIAATPTATAAPTIAAIPTATAAPTIAAIPTATAAPTIAVVALVVALFSFPDVLVTVQLIVAAFLTALFTNLAVITTTALINVILPIVPLAVIPLLLHLHFVLYSVIPLVVIFIRITTLACAVLAVIPLLLHLYFVLYSVIPLVVIFIRITTLACAVLAVSILASSTLTAASTLGAFGACTAALSLVSVAVVLNQSNVDALAPGIGGVVADLVT